jgi:hypothetical protein
MNLYITDANVPPLSGVVIQPKHMALKLTHLVLASQTWSTLYIDIVESIPEGTLRFLHTKCERILVACPEHPTLHQLHLLIELFPKLDGQLRKAFMKGDAIHGLLHEVWGDRDTLGRDVL